MADLQQLQDAMGVTLKSMAEDIIQQGEDIRTRKQLIEKGTKDFYRLFQSFLSLAESKDNMMQATEHMPVNIVQPQQQVQDILKTQQAAMQQANPPNIKMPTSAKGTT